MLVKIDRTLVNRDSKPEKRTQTGCTTIAKESASAMKADDASPVQGAYHYTHIQTHTYTYKSMQTESWLLIIK
jgi:hypothetical protein